MAKYRLYQFNPINPEKYAGDILPITMRSSWEVEFAKTCDLLPSVLKWSYETHQIPYKDPLTGTQKVYIPDFFVEVAQSDGYSVHYVFEIKPMNEQYDNFARNGTDAAMIARNNAKWEAAIKWADRHSAEFVILNESDIFAWHNKRKPRVRAVKAFSHTHATKVAKPKGFSVKKMTSSPSASKSIARAKARITTARATRVSSVKRVRKI
jgi:hypothetical protein